MFYSSIQGYAASDRRYTEVLPGDINTDKEKGSQTNVHYLVISTEGQ